MISIKRISLKDDLSSLIRDIQNAAWLEASEISSEEYTWEHIVEFLKKEESVFVVAYSDGLFAGMASAKILNKPNGDVWLYIDEVDVCADKQRQGIGKALMNELFHFAKESNCDEVWVGTEVHNFAANALYTSLEPQDVQDFIGYTYVMNK